MTRVFYFLVFLLPLFWLPFSFETWEFSKLFLLVFSVLALLIFRAIPGIVASKMKKTTSPGDVEEQRVPATLKILWPTDLLVALFLLAALVSTIFSVDKVFSVFGFYGRFSDGLIALFAFVGVYFLASRHVTSTSGVGGNLTPDLKQENVEYSGDRLICPRFCGKVSKTLLFSGLAAMVIAYLAVFGILGKVFGGISPVLMQKSFNPVAPSLEGLLVFLLPLIFLSFPRTKRTEDGPPALSAIIFLVLTLGLVVIMFFGFPARFFGQIPREVTLDKLTSWQVALDAIRVGPFRALIGSGPGTFFYDFARFKPASFIQTDWEARRGGALGATHLWQIRFDRAGSHMAEMGATMGVTGLIFYLLLIGWVIVKNFQFSIFNFQSIFNDLIFKHSLLLTFVASAVLQFFYYQNMASGFVFWLLLGMLAGLSAKEKIFTRSGLVASTPGVGRNLTPGVKNLKDNWRVRTTVVFGTVGLAVFLLLVVFWATRIYLADAFYGKALRKSAGSEKVELLKKAVLINPHFSEYWIILARSFLENVVRESQKPGDANAQKVFQDVVQAVDSAKQATAISPRWVASWETLGMLYQEVQGLAEGAQDWGIKSLERAIELEPTNPLLYIKLGRMFFAKDEMDKAQKQFERARALKPDLLDPWVYLALVWEKKGENDRAIEFLEKALNISPDNQTLKEKLEELKNVDKGL